MTTEGEDAVDRDGWHLWHYYDRYYARRLNTSPPVVVSGATEDERDAKIAAYMRDGRKALDDM